MKTTSSLKDAKRIIILGRPGSGKSTLARILGERLGLPVVYLDTLFWLPNWQKNPDFASLAEERVLQDAWVMDGNFFSGLPNSARIARANVIFFLDYCPLVCARNALKRARQYKGKSRPDITTGCAEKVDLDFLLYILFGYRHSRQRAKNVIKENPDKPAFVFRNRKALTMFLSAL